MKKDLNLQKREKDVKGLRRPGNQCPKRKRRSHEIQAYINTKTQLCQLLV